MPVISTEAKRSGETCGPLGARSLRIQNFARIAGVFAVFALTAIASGSETSGQSGAEAFIRRIYAPYAKNSTYSSLGPDRKGVYSPDLKRLIDADEKRTPVGFKGMIEDDPLCDCTDSDDLKILELRSNVSAGHMVNAIVTLQLSKDPSMKRVLALRLIHEPTGWRVDDITPPNGLSLRQLLTSPHA